MYYSKNDAGDFIFKEKFINPHPLIPAHKGRGNYAPSFTTLNISNTRSESTLHTGDSISSIDTASGRRPGSRPQ